MSDVADYVVIINDRIHNVYSELSDAESAQVDNYCAGNLDKPHIFVKTSDWQAREALRIRDGFYQALPDYFPSISGHFVHVSRFNPSLIAYTENDTKGAKDIQTSCKPGRYLMKYFGDTLPGDEIQKITRQLSAGDKFQLKFVTTREEIRWTYENGPQSCMRQFEGIEPIHKGIHAVEAYAAGDLAIAYLCNGNGEALSRVLCWPEKKVFLDSFYPRRGHDDYQYTEKLIQLIENEGYRVGDISGAKMLKIPHNGGFILPYLDGDYGLNDKGDHFVIDSDDPQIDCQITGGMVYIEEPTRCYNCSSRIDDDEQCNFNDFVYCEGCYDDMISTCDRCEESVMTDDIIYLRHINMDLCPDCHGDTLTCVSCNNIFLEGDILIHGGNGYCESCLDKHMDQFDKDTPQCDECGEGRQVELDSDAPVVDVQVDTVVDVQDELFTPVEESE